MHTSIIIMTRFPEAGQVKTRLIPSHGAEGACALHKAMTEYTLNECLSLDAQVCVYYTGAEQESMEHWLKDYKSSTLKTDALKIIPQVQGHLGDKMFAALKNTSHISPPHKQKIIIIGSDCPDNGRDNLQRAVNLLDNYDCVLGPSEDGGYYLIGFTLNANCYEQLNKINHIFQDITWGTEKVFAQSMAKIKQLGLNYILLPKLNDVDEARDVPTKISVIIPTINEEKALNTLLDNLPASFNTEIIICDANSTDNTIEVANKFKAICIQSEQGRAKQCLSAIAQSSGDILLFLHADCHLPSAWDGKIRNALQDENNSLGYFRFGLKEDFWTKGIIEWGVKLRCKYFKLPFGDQGLFVRKKDFEHWNLPEVPILEDVFLVKKARQEGRLIALNETLYTSGRRWLKHGLVRTTIINASVLLCASFGMDLHLIKDAYSKGKNPILYYLFSSNS